MIPENQQTYNKSTRNYLMGIAMILVVLFHISQHGEYQNVFQKTIYFLFGNGFLGVDMFFLLSTYGLSFSYNNNSLKRFYINRFVRLMPLYPLSLIIGYIKAGTPFRQALNEFIQQITGIALLNNTLDILWYIEALILLYVFFPLLYKFCYRLKNLSICSLVIICASFHFLLIIIPDYWLQMTVGRIPMMIIGVMTYIYNLENNNKKLFQFYGSLALIAIAPVFKDMYFYIPAALLLIAKSNLRICYKFLCFIGVHTYEIFIGHHFAMWGFGHISNNYYITLFAIILLIITYSTIFHYIQKYSSKVITNHLKKS